MTEPEQTQTPIMQRSSTRRAVLAGTVGAGTAALAYAALGARFDGDAGTAGEPAPESAASILPEETAVADTATIESESGRVSHLLRRAGFGVNREEFERYQAMGLDQTISELVNYTQVDDSEAEELAAQFPIEPSERGIPPIWWLTRIANTRRPLQEKMTLFWHGLLTSQISEVRDPTAMVAQNEMFRAQAFGSFPEMLRTVSQDPAMMVYLNIHGSSRRAPNENYARELMNSLPSEKATIPRTMFAKRPPPSLAGRCHEPVLSRMYSSSRRRSSVQACSTMAPSHSWGSLATSGRTTSSASSPISRPRLDTSCGAFSHSSSTSIRQTTKLSRLLMFTTSTNAVSAQWLKPCCAPTFSTRTWLIEPWSRAQLNMP